MIVVAVAATASRTSAWHRRTTAAADGPARAAERATAATRTAESAAASARSTAMLRSATSSTATSAHFLQKRLQRQLLVLITKKHSNLQL